MKNEKIRTAIDSELSRLRVSDALARRGFDGPVNMEVCKDISHGLYAFDLADPAERDTVRAILADARAFWLGAPGLLA